MGKGGLVELALRCTTSIILYNTYACSPLRVPVDQVGLRRAVVVLYR